MFVEKIFQAAAHTGSIYALGKDSENNIYSAGSEGVVLRWNLNQIDSPIAIAKVSGQIFSLCLVEEQNHLWLGTMSGAVHVLDLNLKKEIHHFTNHTASVFDIQFHLGKIFIASKDGSISIWEATTRKFIQTVFISEGGLRKISFHPTKNEIAIGSSDNSIYIFQGREDGSGKMEEVSLKPETLNLKLTTHTNSVFSLCYSPDGKYLLSGGRDAMLNCWNAEENYSLKKSLPAHLYTINDIVMLDENHFATASRDKHIKIWELESLELLKVLNKEKSDAHLNSVNKLCWLAPEKILITASDDRSIIGWRILI